MMSLALLRAFLRPLSRLLGATTLVFLPCAVPAQTIAEPPSYRLSDFRAPTPTTVNGQPGLTTAQAHALWEGGQAIFIDVLPHPPRPANLPPSTIWREKQRSDIPRSVWLPDTGYGALAPETEAYFKRGLQRAVKGKTDPSLIFYCLRQCWMSWNAAKRAMSLGYGHVFWYPDGTDGWAQSGFPLEVRTPLPRD